MDKHYKDYIQIGLNIMRYRKEQGLTQDQLSEMAGYSRNHLQRVETAVCKPTVGLLLDVSEVLGGKDADLIYKHLNREAYAEDVLKQYGAEITPYGMVNREDFGPLHEPISEQQQEQTQEPQMGM